MLCFLVDTCFCISLCVGIALFSNMHSQHLYTIHESQMWFSNIKPVEREISFRTESGLYYSYFKQFVAARSVASGFYELKNDNLTEHGNTINVINRMTIYPEVALGLIYRILMHFRWNDYIPHLFYTYSVFRLQSIAIASISAMTFILSRSRVAAFVAPLLYMFNLVDVTRVAWTIALRESFALPFLWAFIASHCGLLAVGYSKSRYLFLFLQVFCGVCLLASWQFSPFLVLLHSIASHVLWLLRIIDTRLAVLSLPVHLLLYIVLFQPSNLFVIGSLAVSYALVTIAWLQLSTKYVLFRPPPLYSGFWKTLFRVAFSLIAHAACALLLNATLQIVLRIDSDEHIGKFVRYKLFGAEFRDFDLRLYLCLEIFQFLPSHVIGQLKEGWVLLPYLFGYCALIVYCVYTSWLCWKSDGSSTSEACVENSPSPSSSPSPTSTRNSTTNGVTGVRRRAKKDRKANTLPVEPNAPPVIPRIESQLSPLPRGGKICEDIHLMADRRAAAWAYIAVIVTLHTIVALSTQRMKYLWTPLMCAIGPAVIGKVQFLDLPPFLRAYFGDNRFFYDISRKVASTSVLALLVAGAYQARFPQLQQMFDSLQEFWDPDTVQLMEWISANTPRAAAFTGSMQLMAGVKLCTGRPIANHPHYEDKDLRFRTKELGQVYSQRSPEDIHSILQRYDVSYIILEDSICIIPKKDGCRFVDTIDIDNGHITEYGVPHFPDLISSLHPRFCDRIRRSHSVMKMKRSAKLRQSDAYARLFNLVLENKTFRVYSVNAK